MATAAPLLQTSDAVLHDPPRADPSRLRLEFVDGLRAFAIITIIVTHCMPVALTERDPTVTSHFFRTIIAGNTALFVFVSGLLIAYLNPGGAGITRFWQKKSANVLMPALLWIGALAAMRFAIGGPLPHDYQTAIYYINDVTSRSALWYIPFVCMLFVVSPAIHWWMRQGRSAAAALLIISFAVGMTINRAPHNIDKLQNLGYFLFFFVFGMAVAMNAREWMKVVRMKATLIASGLGILAFAALQNIYLTSHKHAQPPFSEIGPDFLFTQKVLLCIFISGIFVRFPQLVGKRTKFIAAISFGLFFVHELWIEMFRWLELIPPSGVAWPVATAQVSLLVLAGSYLTVMAIRRAAGNKARYLLGP